MIHVSHDQFDFREVTNHIVPEPMTVVNQDVLSHFYNVAFLLDGTGQWHSKTLKSGSVYASYTVGGYIYIYKQILFIMVISALGHCSLNTFL